MNEPAIAPQFLVNVEELRREFDQVFALPAPVPSADVEDFLIIRVGTRQYALPVPQLIRVEAHRTIVALPAENRSLLGIVGFHGRLMPVYCLEMLFGSASTRGETNWIAACDRSELIGLAFDELIRYLRVPRTDIVRVDSPEPSQELVQDAVRGPEAVWPIISLARVLEAIRKTVSFGTAKER